MEDIKEESRGLRGGLPDALKAETDNFAEAEKQLLKFHGIYQQDDRDARRDGKEYSFMIRSRIPGGRLTAAQYLVHDDLADRFGNGTLRITTRQAFQLHGVIKGDLPTTMREINESLVTTLAACGDVVRNVIYSPLPPTEAYHHEIEKAARDLADHLLPRTRAYHEVWLDGEKVHDGKVEEEPLYGPTYLPRKFKIGFAFPGDNSVDVYTQDVGLISVVEEGVLQGFNVVAGGGLGMTHKKPETFPRLADPITFATPGELVQVVEEIIRIQRDNGDRLDRRHARLKYLIHDWGVERFRNEISKRLGRPLADPVATPPLELELYLGWHPHGENRWYLGLSIENGRIEGRVKTALREIVRRFEPGIRLTPSQDLLLTDVTERAAIDAILRRHGVRSEKELSNARKYSMACPALPTCGLALAESERVLPAVIDELERELEALGLADERLTVRMTGCPNGCARPYVSDIGFVGRSLNQYTIFLGGRSDGTRLNEPYRDLVALEELVPVLRPLLTYFKTTRESGESFGDFCHRLGNEALQEFADRNEEYAYAR